MTQITEDDMADAVGTHADLIARMIDELEKDGLLPDGQDYLQMIRDRAKANAEEYMLDCLFRPRSVSLVRDALEDAGVIIAANAWVAAYKRALARAEGVAQ